MSTMKAALPQLSLKYLRQIEKSVRDYSIVLECLECFWATITNQNQN